MGEGRKTFRKYALVFICVVFGLLFFVWQRIQVICEGYKIDKLKVTLAVLEERNNALQREVSSYTNYEGIDMVAKGGLKMIYPKSENIVYLVE
jgi:cell division protein FtsL